MGRLRWKKDPRPTGLIRTLAEPQGSKYWDGETTYASIGSVKDWNTGKYVGWGWSCPAVGQIPHKNTYLKPVKTEAEAKKQAADYIKKHLNKLFVKQ
jgi:hypothetical protein